MSQSTSDNYVTQLWDKYTATLAVYCLRWKTTLGFSSDQVILLSYMYISNVLLLFLGVNISTVFEGDLVPALYKPPYTLDSTARYSYQTPAVKSELSENLSRRFGCNKNNHKPAVGAGR